LSCLTGVLAAAGLPAKIQEILDGASTIRRGVLGLQIVNLKSGKVLFESNSDRLFVPASNSKLFTTALGLTRLGPDHRFHTTVVAGGEPDADGSIAGPLTLVGDGDPNLSGRELPYRVDSPPGDGLQAIEDLASQVVARGVRRIEGDIVGDDTAYVWDPYPDGWGLGDALWEYGAPVSALTINDNAFILRILPGDPARISIEPPLEFYQIDNQVRAGAVRKIRVEREPGSRQLRIWGTLPLKGPGQGENLAIHDPALYAAVALRDALARRGVAIRGEALARHALPGQPVEPSTGFELARRDSAPLLDDLRVTAKVSQNLHAELILRGVARARRGVGSVRPVSRRCVRSSKRLASLPPSIFPQTDPVFRVRTWSRPARW
jgi:D-alanyl-D-alanine carboxypeptidase/D-alanyl-D-alanine-endopeptidase (penicillin-binding protein 4)